MTYVCVFNDVPDYVSPTEHAFGEEWFRPSHAYVGYISCWRPEFEGREEGTGRFVIPPHGPLTLTCHFDEASPTPR